METEFVNVSAAGDKVYALGRPSATKCMHSEVYAAARKMELLNVSSGS